MQAILDLAGALASPLTGAKIGLFNFVFLARTCPNGLLTTKHCQQQRRNFCQRYTGISMADQALKSRETGPCVKAQIG